MYNIDMRRETDTLKGFTIIETMLFLALTGLMLVGAMVGIGTNLSRTRYRDTVEDIATMLRTQYDQVNRTQIQLRDDTGMCDMLSGTYDFTKKNNIGRGRSNCDVYGVAVIFGLNDETLGEGRIVQTNNILGKDVAALEEEILKKNEGSTSTYIDPKEEIAGMNDQELLKALGLNNIVQRNGRCETVNVLDRKVLNWGARVEGVERNVAKKAIMLIIRSPRDGTVHTYVYDFTGREDIGILDYSDLPEQTCRTAVSNARSVDINEALNSADGAGNPLFSNTKNFTICISSDDAISTYGRRRMLTIKADGHNSSAVELIDMESEDNKCL